MDNSQAYTQVSSGNETLYIGVSCDELLDLGYTDLDFQSDKDSYKFTFEFVFTLGGRVVNWRSVKESCTVDSIWKSSMLQLL